MDVFRVGKISSINYEAGRVRVVYDDRDKEVTAEFPLQSFFYMMPKVDDYVAVLHLPNGSAKGIVLGRFWTQKNKPLEGFKGLFHLAFSRAQDKCYIKYADPDEDDGNGNDGTLLIKNDKKTRGEAEDHERESKEGILDKAKNITREASEKISDRAQSIVIEADATAEITAGSTLTVTGKGQVRIEGGNIEISGGTVNITGTVNVVQSDPAYIKHTHNCTAPGTPSGPPI